MSGFTRSASLAAAVALLFGLGCAMGASRGPGPDASRSAEDSVVARVQNDSYYNLTVYVGDDARRDRLGDVSSFGSGRFRVPSDMVYRGGQIQFFADPVGDTFLYRSIPVSVSPGQIVEWKVKIDPAQTRGAIMVLNG